MAVELAKRSLCSRNPGCYRVGLPEYKDVEQGSQCLGCYESGTGSNSSAQSVAELVVISDVCLCQYTSHGHCGMLKGEKIDNDSTLPLLAQTALSHAEAGADIVAPSDT